jgi:hypothetical protein
MSSSAAPSSMPAAPVVPTAAAATVPAAAATAKFVFCAFFAMLTFVPNLAGKFLKLIAKDDAALVTIVRVSDVASGKIPMPFLHPHFLAEFYKDTNAVLYKQLQMVTFWCKFRNIRVMRKVNAILVTLGKIPHTITDCMLETESQLSEMLIKSAELGVDPSLYLDESSDADDVSECTNSWNLDQSLKPLSATDPIPLITDVDGVDCLPLIKRKNGPGRNQMAYPGGFVEPGENPFAAALRELDEETELGIEDYDENVEFTRVEHKLTQFVSNFWDPRGKFATFGAINDGMVIHYTFTRRTVQ